MSKPNKTPIPLATVTKVEEHMNSARDIFAKANHHADEAVRLYVDTGNQLRKARALLVGDKEFGQFRVKHIPYMSAKWAGDLMRIAERFDTEALPPVSISVLKEISRASDTVVKDVTAKAEAGEKVTVKAARKMVKDERADVSEADGPSPTSDAPSPPSGTPSSGRDVVAGTSVGGRSSVSPVDTDEDSGSMPDGEYEMVPLTVDDLDLIIGCLRNNGHEDCMELALRLEA